MNYQDTVYKGMTRSALILGVPILPFIMGTMAIILLGVWTNIIFWTLILPYFIMLYLLTKYDENIFSIYFNAIKTNTLGINKKYHRVKTISGAKYQPNKNTSQELSIYPLNKQKSISDFVPFSTHIADNIVSTKEHEYIITFAINGINFDMVDNDELLSEKGVINSLISSLSSEDVFIYTHSINILYEDRLDGDYSSNYLQEFANDYSRGMSNKDIHLNLRYLSIVYCPLNTRAKKIDFSKKRLEKRKKEIKKFLKKTENLATKILSSLGKYGVKQLGIYSENGIKYSESLEFYNFLLSGILSKVKLLNIPLDEYSTANIQHLKFHKEILKIEHVNGKISYSQCLEIKEFCNDTNIGILNKLLQSGINYVLTQSYEPMEKRKALYELKLQQKRLMGTEDVATSQIEEIKEALDLLMGDKISFGKYHFSMFVYADSVETLKEHSEYAIALLEEMGNIINKSDLSLPATYFSQLPANTHLRPYISTLSSLNFSDFISFHKYPLGRREGNNWGESIALIDTPSGNPYYLNLHEENGENDFNKFTLGNSIVIGKAGTGKTAMLNFLFNMMMKYNDYKTFPKNIPEKTKKYYSFYLDMKYGAMANILCAGGEYITLKNGESTGFNPFMCDNTENNIRNLEILISILISDKIKITPRIHKKIHNAVNTVMTEFNKEERSYPISLLLENIDEEYNNEDNIKDALELWKRGNKFGWVFDNEKDSFLHTDNNIIGIDGTEFLDDRDVKASMSFYILWRVMDYMDGRRLGIFIDEAWKWIEDDYISDELKNKFKTNRSQNSFIVLASQSAEDLLQNKNARAFVEQTASMFLFANPKAQLDDYVKGLSCSESEYLKVKNFALDGRNFLIKKGEESTVGKINFENMDKFYLRCVSTDKIDVVPIENIFNQDKNLSQKIEDLKKYYKDTDGH